MKKIKPGPVLIFSNLDGAILDAKTKKIHRQIKKILAEERRFNLVVVTNQSWEKLSAYKEDLDLSLPQITENGATIVDPIAGKILHKKTIPRRSLERIEKMARKRKLEINYVSDKRGVGHVSLVLDTEGAGKVIQELSSIERIAFVLEREVGSKNTCLIDITPGAVDKLSGVRKWLELFANKINFENICVVGSNMGDLPLFSREDFYRAAAEDGAEELKEQADTIIPPARQAGFVSLLRSLVPTPQAKKSSTAERLRRLIQA